jgi:hypothetical protein
LNRALVIAMIQGKSNDVRRRDKGHDYCDYAIQGLAVSDAESKEVDPQ